MSHERNRPLPSPLPFKRTPTANAATLEVSVNPSPLYGFWTVTFQAAPNKPTTQLRRWRIAAESDRNGDEDSDGRSHRWRDGKEKGERRDKGGLEMGQIPEREWTETRHSMENFIRTAQRQEETGRGRDKQSTKTKQRQGKFDKNSVPEAMMKR